MTTPQLFNWLLLSILTLGVLWLLYQLALRRERCFQYNRTLLLLAPPAAAVLPLLHLPAPWLPTVPTVVQAPLHLLLPSATVTAAATNAPAIALASWLLLVYGGGVALLLGRLGGQLLVLRRFTRRLPAEPHAGYTLRRTGGRRPTSSFARTVYWDDTIPLTAAEAAQVLRHELVHVRQHHTLDRLWLRVWQALLWPNPFVHLLPRALDLTHEYLADAAVAPATPTDYVRLLARQATGWLGQVPTLAHSFFSSSTLTRIAMLNRSSVPRRWKQWLALPVCAALLFVVACEKDTPVDEAAIQKQINDQASSMPAPPPPPPPPVVWNASSPIVRNAKGEQVYNYVEQMPEYPGGMNALLQHIGKSIRYPGAAIADKLEGMVFVQFTITKDGNIEDVNLKKGIQQKLTLKTDEKPDFTTHITTPTTQAMNEEALRVVRELPRWTPGRQDGQPVNVSFTIPISYALQ